MIKWLKGFWNSMSEMSPVDKGIMWANYYTALNNAKKRRMKCSNCENFKDKKEQ